MLSPKVYTKGERVLRFEANRAQHRRLAYRPGTGQVRRHPVARLTSMVDRFTSLFDCVDTTFVTDGILDQLPHPARAARSESAAWTPTSPHPRRDDRRHRHLRPQPDHRRREGSRIAISETDTNWDHHHVDNGITMTASSAASMTDNTPRREEPHHLPADLQTRHVRVQIDPVQTRHVKIDMPVQDV